MCLPVLCVGNICCGIFIHLLWVCPHTMLVLFLPQYLCAPCWQCRGFSMNYYLHTTSANSHKYQLTCIHAHTVNASGLSLSLCLIWGARDYIIYVVCYCFCAVVLYAGIRHNFVWRKTIASIYIYIYNSIYSDASICIKYTHTRKYSAFFSIIINIFRHFPHCFTFIFIAIC